VGKLNPGKVPNDILKTIVFGRLGCEDDSVILGPSIGEDAALIKLNGRIVAFKSDPITGSVEEVGLLSVYVNANDIATRGALPRWFLQCILLPQGYSTADLEGICRQIDNAAKEVGVSVVGGHTEVTPGISRPIVIGSMIGLIEDGKFLTTSGSKPGDSLFMTKSAGIEGTAILSSAKSVASKFGGDFVKRCKELIKLINVVDECLILRDEKVTSIHDLTEGGLLGGVWEVAEASSSGVLLDLRSVPVLKETEIVCSELGLDPFRLISSGSVIFTVPPEHEEGAEKALKRAGIRCTRIGQVLPRSEGRSFIDQSGEKHPLAPPSTDELWRGLR
jgi:hydrogenase expression/formation protein HypE